MIAEESHERQIRNFSITAQNITSQHSSRVVINKIIERVFFCSDVGVLVIYMPLIKKAKTWINILNL